MVQKTGQIHNYFNYCACKYASVYSGAFRGRLEFELKFNKDYHCIKLGSHAYDCPSNNNCNIYPYLFPPNNKEVFKKS